VKRVSLTEAELQAIVRDATTAGASCALGVVANLLARKNMASVPRERLIDLIECLPPEEITRIAMTKGAAIGAKGATDAVLDAMLQRLGVKPGGSA
jgi:hypothetical protein